MIISLGRVSSIQSILVFLSFQFWHCEILRFIPVRWNLLITLHAEPAQRSVQQTSSGSTELPSRNWADPSQNYHLSAVEICQLWLFMKSLVDPINVSILPCLFNVTLLSKHYSLTLTLLKEGGKYKIVIRNIYEMYSVAVKSEKRLGFGLKQS